MATLDRQHYISAPLREQPKARWPRALIFCCIAFVLILFVIGCKSNAVSANDAGVDPAAANMAPAGSSGQPSQALAQNSSYTPQQQGQSYERAPNTSGNDSYNNTISSDEAAGEQAVDESDQPPPPLPEYDQPPDPDPNYLWTPGYWAWGPDGYYWVPGVWCPPPYYGALWTPPYWGWYSGHYRFHHGYWGPHVGFYGGIDYGFGYIGVGYFGGYWRGHDFYYNRSVNNVGNVRNTYNRDVIYNNVHYSARPSNRTSYNGGNGGVNVAPRPTELAAMHETHARPIAAQTQVRQQAAGDRQQLYNQNHGRPAQAAFARPAGEAGPAHIAETPPAIQRVQQRDAAIQQHNAPMENRPGAAAENRPGAAAGNRPVVPAINVHPPEGQRTQPIPRPGEMNRPESPPNRSAPGNPAALPSRPEPTQRPGQVTRPLQPSRPEPVMRPEPVNRPQYAPQSRPMPQSRPEPSAPIAHPEAAPRTEPQPRPEAIQRPEPAPRAAPEQAPRPSPAPAPRVAPAPAARPAPEGGHEDRPH